VLTCPLPCRPLQLDKLHVGREQQLMLSTAINTANYHQQTAGRFMGAGHHHSKHGKLPAIGMSRCVVASGAAGCRCTCQASCAVELYVQWVYQQPAVPSRRMG
jgi:hypothetical protein